MNQQDRQGLLAAKPVFEWHARHEDLYVGQTECRSRPAARRRRTRRPIRGFFRLLSEQHIPFAVSENLRWMDDPSRRFDLVIVPGRAA